MPRYLIYEEDSEYGVNIRKTIDLERVVQHSELLQKNDEERKYEVNPNTTLLILDTGESVVVNIPFDAFVTGEFPDFNKVNRG